TGGDGTDTAFGDAGNDTLKWDSADSFDGGAGFDTIDASNNSADTIDLRGMGFTNVERVLTGSGKDVVTLSLNEVLTETADRQFIADMGGGNPDTLKIDIGGGWTATTANKTLGSTAVAAGISVHGNMKAYTFTNGTDTVTIFSNAEVVQYITPLPALFTTLDDIIDFNSVSAANYALGTQYDALAGNDTVTLPVDAAAATHAGYDVTQAFHGGDGNDTITAGNLDATIYGDAGMDVLRGGNGNDTLVGGTLADTLSGGLGNDVLDGGTGTDTVDYHAAASAVTVDLAQGTATGEGTDSLLNLENVTGSAFNDTITGNALNNVLQGGDGDDTIHGGDGNDTITGGAGTDHLFGDAGNDTLTWDNADSFDGGAGFDTIDAVLISADTIDMRGPAFANVERIQTGSGKDVLTLSLNDVLSDTADHQFIADMGSSSPDTLNIDTAGGWTATTADPTLGATAVAAGISVTGMTAYTFTNGADIVTVFSNAEVVQSQVLSA
ncbi:calcium-binding protein, partial [Dongia soli]